MHMANKELIEKVGKYIDKYYELGTDDTETAEMKKTEMYMDGFKAKLEKDTSYRGLWTVSFGLKET